jgi:hypothetical protein
VDDGDASNVPLSEPDSTIVPPSDGATLPAQYGPPDRNAAGIPDKAIAHLNPSGVWSSKNGFDADQGKKRGGLTRA